MTREQKEQDLDKTENGQQQVQELKAGSKVSIMSVFSPPAPAMQEEGIETLLEPLVLAAIRLNRLANSSIDMDEIDKATEVYAAARTALLAHYHTMKTEPDQ